MHWKYSFVFSSRIFFVFLIFFSTDEKQRLQICPSCSKVSFTHLQMFLGTIVLTKFGWLVVLVYWWCD
jgi:hypothetical protein